MKCIDVFVNKEKQLLLRGGSCLERQDQFRNDPITLDVKENKTL